MTQPASKRGFHTPPRANRPGRPGSGVPKITFNLAGNRFECSCSPFKNQWYCPHIQEFFATNSDLVHIVAAHERGVPITYRLPIAQGYLYVEALATMHHLPAGEGQYSEVLVVEDAGKNSDVQVWLAIEEGFQIFINMVTDWYSSRLIFRHIEPLIRGGKPLPCDHKGHSASEFMELKRNIILFGQNNVALGNAYTLHNFKKCVPCYRFSTDFSQDAPVL